MLTGARERRFALRDVEMADKTKWYVDDSGALRIDELLAAFQQFFREHSEHWAVRFQYQEAGPQLLLQAFLKFVVEGKVLHKSLERTVAESVETDGRLHGPLRRGGGSPGRLRPAEGPQLGRERVPREPDGGERRGGRSLGYVTRWTCWAVVVAASTLAACGDSGTEPPPAEPPANRAPEVRGSIPDQALTPGGPAATVDVANNFADPDGDALSYAVSSSNSGVAAASISGTVVTVQPVAPGAATVTVTARDAGGLTASLSFAVTVTGSPDLVASLSPDNVAVAPGGSFEYAVAVRNRGDVAAPATRVRTFVSADSVVTTSDEMVGEPSDVPALGPGESASRAASMTVSSSASPGTVMWVGECVDPVEEESDVDNNCSAALKVVVTGSPDLVASVSPDSVAVAPGGSFEYAVAVRNQGDGAASATRVGTFVSADSVVTTSDEMVGEPSDVPALGPGESASRAASMTVDSSASPGTVMWVGECVDPVEGESDVDNNCSAALKVVVTGSPDLVASVSPDSVAVAPGGSFDYAVAVRNQGDAAAPATRVRTFVSVDSVVTTSDEMVGRASRVPALGPGDSVRGTASMTVSSSASPGTVVWLGECVDPVEGESDTGNNCSAALKLVISATGGLRAAGVPVAQQPRGPVVWPAGQIKFGPVARSSRPSPADAKGSPR